MKTREKKYVLGDAVSGLCYKLDLLTTEFYSVPDSLLNSDPYNLPIIFPLLFAAQ